MERNIAALGTWVIADAFRVRTEKKIGAGSFGHVYKAVVQGTGEEVAVKVEPSNCKSPCLYYETRLYRLLQGQVGIPNVRWYGVEAGYNIMVMDLLGASLDDLFVRCNRRFSLQTVLMIAEQVISRVEYLHSKDFIHRDLKPGNLTIGRGKKGNVIYLIDLGLSKRYRDNKTHQHIAYRETKGITGTVRYSSMNAHIGIEGSRRDDLESLAYIFIEFLTGTLPWSRVKEGSKRKKFMRIGDLKMSIPIEELCKGLPQEFATYLTYCRSLRFDEKPDYSYLRRLFRGLFNKEGFSKDVKFDWVKEEKEPEKAGKNQQEQQIKLFDDDGAVNERAQLDWKNDHRIIGSEDGSEREFIRRENEKLQSQRKVRDDRENSRMRSNRGKDAQSSWRNPTHVSQTNPVPSGVVRTNINRSTADNRGKGTLGLNSQQQHERNRRAKNARTQLAVYKKGMIDPREKEKEWAREREMEKEREKVRREEQENGRERRREKQKTKEMMMEQERQLRKNQRAQKQKEEKEKEEKRKEREEKRKAEMEQERLNEEAEFKRQLEQTNQPGSPVETPNDASPSKPQLPTPQVHLLTTSTETQRRKERLKMERLKKMSMGIYLNKATADLTSDPHEPTGRPDQIIPLGLSQTHRPVQETPTPISAPVKPRETPTPISAPVKPRETTKTKTRDVINEWDDFSKAPRTNVLLSFSHPSQPKTDTTSSPPNDTSTPKDSPPRDLPSVFVETSKPLFPSSQSHLPQPPLQAQQPSTPPFPSPTTSTPTSVSPSPLSQSPVTRPQTHFGIPQINPELKNEADITKAVMLTKEDIIPDDKDRIVMVDMTTSMKKILRPSIPLAAVPLPQLSSTLSASLPPEASIGSKEPSGHQEDGDRKDDEQDSVGRGQGQTPVPLSPSAQLRSGLTMAKAADQEIIDGPIANTRYFPFFAPADETSSRYSRPSLFSRHHPPLFNQNGLIVKKNTKRLFFGNLHNQYENMLGQRERGRRETVSGINPLLERDSIRRGSFVREIPGFRQKQGSAQDKSVEAGGQPSPQLAMEKKEPSITSSIHAHSHSPPKEPSVEKPSPVQSLRRSMHLTISAEQISLSDGTGNKEEFDEEASKCIANDMNEILNELKQSQVNTPKSFIFTPPASPTTSVHSNHSTKLSLHRHPQSPLVQNEVLNSPTSLVGNDQVNGTHSRNRSLLSSSYPPPLRTRDKDPTQKSPVSQQANIQSPHSDAHPRQTFPSKQHTKDPSPANRSESDESDSSDDLISFIHKRARQSSHDSPTASPPSRPSPHPFYTSGGSIKRAPQSLTQPEWLQQTNNPLQSIDFFIPLSNDH
ncbi:putative Casein kinase I [Blattamonas nauphoetae]|uniref:non-specific serine/threonine protein kinase n=1 Tax=Blattamonas nauphoetae TaxID=2049346 RepID=A0ABQ9YKS6_9EUKA|nr:putative Casein kinase I [Blattamonas nauphoetae]